MHELILPGSKDTLFNHQKHHQNPQSLKVRSIHRIIFLLILLLSIWLSVINGGYTPIIPGFLFGFTIYNHLHYILHRPIGKYILPNVQRAHILHHYNRPHHGFSFSTSLWDWLFRTQPPKEDMITESMLKKYFLNSEDIS
jgi:sterol desaturase/sphingolipid hydroxylase (fatty acid hydroxylase superfamily)